MGKWSRANMHEVAVTVVAPDNVLSELQVPGRPPSQAMSTVSELMQYQDTDLSLGSSFTLFQSRIQQGDWVPNPGIVSLPACSYLAAATAPPQPTIDGARVDVLIWELMVAILPRSLEELATIVETTVEQHIKEALQRGGDNHIWRLIAPQIDERVDKALEAGLTDTLLPVYHVVQAQLEEELLERKLTMAAKNCLERLMGPGLAVLQATAVKEEALRFSASIQDITVAHIDCEVDRLVNESMGAVTEDQVAMQTAQWMWWPDNAKVATAMDQAAAMRVDDAIGWAVDQNFCDMRNISSPLRHAMSTLARNNLTHLCPLMEVERMVAAQFAKSNYFWTWSHRMNSRLQKLLTHLEQEADCQHKNVKAYIKPMMRDLTNHRDDLLHEFS